MKGFVIFLFSVLLLNSVLGADNCVVLKGVKEGFSVPGNFEDIDFEFFNECGQTFFDINITFLKKNIHFEEFNDYINVTMKNITTPSSTKNLELFIKGGGLNQRFVIPFEIKPIIEIEKSVYSLQNNTLSLIESIENNLRFIIYPLNKDFKKELKEIKELNDFGLKDFELKNYSRSRAIFLKNLPKLINLGSRVKKFLSYEFLIIGLFFLIFIFYVVNIIFQKLKQEGNILKE